MAPFSKECDLEKAAIPFLRTSGYKYTFGVPLSNRVVDLAAIDEQGNLIGIEFKLTDWKRALSQAQRSKNAFDFVYVCLPGGRYIDKLVREASTHGVGVMTFDRVANGIKIQLPAVRIERQWLPNLRFVRAYINERAQYETS